MDPPASTGIQVNQEYLADQAKKAKSVYQAVRVHEVHPVPEDIRVMMDHLARRVRKDQKVTSVSKVTSELLDLQDLQERQVQMEIQVKNATKKGHLDQKDQPGPSVCQATRAPKVNQDLRESRVNEVILATHFLVSQAHRVLQVRSGYQATVAIKAKKATQDQRAFQEDPVSQASTVHLAHPAAQVKLDNQAIQATTVQSGPRVTMEIQVHQGSVLHLQVCLVHPAHQATKVTTETLARTQLPSTEFPELQESRVFQAHPATQANLARRVLLDHLDHQVIRVSMVFADHRVAVPHR